MDKHFITLRKKLSILATLVVFLITILVGVGFISYQYWREYRFVLGKSISYQTEVTNLSIRESDLETFKDNPAYAWLFTNFFVLLDKNGQIRFNNSPFPNETERKRMFRGSRGTHTFDNDGYFVSRFPLNGGWEVVSMIFHPYSEEKYAQDIVEYAGFISLLSALLYFAISYVVGLILKPVEENMKTMKYFVSVAGHELRTPLASILSSVQLVRATKTYDEETVADIENETKKAGELISSLSELSSMSEGAPKEEIHISEIIHETLKDLDILIKEKGLKVQVKLKNDVTVVANRYYVFILVSNLVSNAVKYNSAGGKIRITIDATRLVIQDTGIGINKNQISKIFDVFYRVSSHRERSEWLGLGLALAKKIAVLYHWKINVTSQEGSGTEFEVRFKS